MAASKHPKPRDSRQGCHWEPLVVALSTKGDSCLESKKQTLGPIGLLDQLKETLVLKAGNVYYTLPFASFMIKAN